MKSRLVVLMAALTLLALSTGVAVAGTGSGTGSEVGYYNGEVYEFIMPSSNSSNPNQFVFTCYSLGPNFTDSPAEPTGTLYAILVEGATQGSCPDGSDKHDHILSTVPGEPGYTPVWNVKIVLAGPNFDPGIMPVTSEQALMAAVNAGQLFIVDPPTPIIFNAPVVGPVP
jgi:hypothetical protein